MAIPRAPALDNTVGLFLRDGYGFVSKWCRKLGSDVFQTRIMLRTAFFMQGEEAAEQFYTPGRFTRKRALPLFAFTLIQDLGSVMVTDGEEHRRRKAMFLSLMMPPEGLKRVAELTTKHWRARVQRWQGKRRVNLFHEAHFPLCAAICEWAGLSLTEREVNKRAREFKAMVEGTGTVGLRNWRGHLMRARTERWMRKVVRGIRAGTMQVPAGSAAEVICNYRDVKGELLDVPSAAVELINVLRPTVANARYMVFAAMALHEHPQWRERLRGSEEDLANFVDEVRRFYPFIPVIGGRVLEPFTWRDHQFKRDDWVLIDLYGTNHDARIWGDPEVFRPDRFREGEFGPFDLISHGAGDRRVTHRCPGEWITTEMIKSVVRLLVTEMQYTVPEQDLRIPLNRIPALPKSRFRMSKVRAMEAHAV